MKHSKVLLTGLHLLLWISLHSQAFFYGPDGKVELEYESRRIGITFAKGISPEEKAQVIAKETQLYPYDPSAEIPHPNLNLIRCKSPLGSKEIRDLCTRLSSLSSIASASPVFRYSDGTWQIPNEVIYAKLSTPENLPLLQELIVKDEHLDFSYVRRDSLLLRLRISSPSNWSSIQLANWLQEQGWFEYVEPDFIRLLQPMHTSDPMVAEQWSLYNDGENTMLYGGMAESDMNVYPAWNISTGHASIKVAVLDEGVDLQHPDLAPNLLPGYDATGQGSMGASNPADAHGTACAGVIAAVGNNGIGIAGVAYNSKVIPIRVAYRAANNWVTTNGWIANAINWAWEQGQADILSNSWGGGSPSSLINEAIDNALRFGRRGLGSPVVFAAGNQNGELSYPASYPETIAVTAMSMCNERKSLTSCDGEAWWGANYGPGVDVAAPGVKISTLDNAGPDGWGTGDYLTEFNGTSAACPNAAGVVALILSTAPDLTATEARYILESSCDKAGEYEYRSFVVGQANGSWSPDLGYGRINAGKALNTLTCDNCLGCLDGIRNGQETGIDCGGPNCLPCATCHDGILNGDEDDIDCGGSCEECLCFDQTLQLTIQFDHYPEETSWTIRRPNGVIVAAAGPFIEAIGLSTYTEEIRLSEGQYIFSLNDSYGDGICCNYGEGSFQLLDSNGAIVIAGHEFSAAASVSFCVRSNSNSCSDGIQNGDETGIDCGGSCAACNNLACVAQVIENSDFETGWGIWQGEIMVRRSSLDQAFANSGDWCIRLAGSANQSGLQTSSLDLSNLSDIEIQFAFTSSGLEKLKEGFSLHLSSDAGKTFTPVAQWKQVRDFINDKPYLESVQLQGPFSGHSVLRFQVDGNSSKDRVYLDDIFISGCSATNEPGQAFSTPTVPPGRNVNAQLPSKKEIKFQLEMALFPNPSRGFLQLQFHSLSTRQSSLQIFNVQGQLVHEESFDEKYLAMTSMRLDLQHLPAGVYWLQYLSNEVKQRKKFMITR